MNTSSLKKYAIQARRDFLAAITNRAAQLGIAAPKGKSKEAVISPAQVTGAAVVIDGVSHPLVIAEPRQLVIDAIAERGFQAMIEQVAYTWFNRFVALRFMELHGYLDHGLRVLSNAGDAAVPEAVERLQDLDLPTLDKAKAIDMAMAGQQDEALFRMILLAQCKHLAPAMPWLFDTRLHDGVDVLLPEGLLATDSILNKLVDDIPEADWTTVDDDGTGNVKDRSVEIIGWLYQFFISERKDEVIGKVVAPEDIPAATQLFTPNWIVQYLVQNSLGRLWLESHPESGLKAHMPYYIEPAEQEPEVQAQLDALVVKGRTPESLKVLDPACGSGHILLEAFRLLFEIYLEQGYRKRDIPRLIFEHNLVGLDIDDRAAQLAGMSLLFEARQHDRRILSDPPGLRVHAFQNGTDADLQAINGSKFTMREEAKELIAFFRDAKTFGSLLRLPLNIVAKLTDLRTAAMQAMEAGDLFLGEVAELLLPLIAQAEAIAERYDAVVANPPYMGGKGMTKAIKDFAKSDYPMTKADTFAMFIERDLELTNEGGHLGFMSPFVWMFISSYEAMRQKLITDHQMTSLVQLEYSGFDGATVPICTFTMGKGKCPDQRGSFIKLSDFRGAKNQGPKTLEAISNTRCGWFYTYKQSDFRKISGLPVAYWIDQRVRNLFENEPSVDSRLDTRQGMATGNNEEFVRNWHEVNLSTIRRDACSVSDAHRKGKWFPFIKGGSYLRWYGNNDFVVAFDEPSYRKLKTQGNMCPSESYYFKENFTCGAITSSVNAFRINYPGTIFDVNTRASFTNSHEELLVLLGVLNSPFISSICKMLNPTLALNINDIDRIPLPKEVFDSDICPLVNKAVVIAKNIWDSSEASIDFRGGRMVNISNVSNITVSWEAACLATENAYRELKSTEIGINHLVATAYGIGGSEGPPPITEVNRPTKETYSLSVISLFIGCALGRYSLGQEGLIYAHAGNIGFDPSRYPTFPADDDGIIPLTDEAWFDDDATERFAEFVSKAWPAEGLEENLQFVAEALGPKKNESSRDTIRRYFSNDFYKDHCQTYKKRPIYWLFSSGKQQAFQCLVYLHRYNADTLGRIRTEYVTPLHGKMRARLAHLEEEKTNAASAAATKTAQKAIDALTKKIDELAQFDDQLRHYADQRIELDLDDGVKVNIQKFGAVNGKGGLIDLKPLGKL